jgi:hypothetical protein
MSNPGRKESPERAIGFRRLSFANNFNGAIIDVTIPAGTEITVANPFRSGKVPTSYIITSDRGDGIIKRGDATWTAETLSFKNISGSSDAAASILVLL